MKVRNILSCALAAVMAVTGLSACAAEKTVGETTTPVVHFPDFPAVDTSGMTELQKAVVITAESFVLRNGIFNTA